MDSQLEKELRQSLVSFEQILDVLPGDRAALEFLSMAYAQLGEGEKALAYTLALVDVVVRERDAEAAASLAERLAESDDPRSQAAVLKLRVLGAPAVELKAERGGPQRDTSATPAIAARAEIALLNRLIDDGVLHRSLVQGAFDQLENLPENGDTYLISALHILERENMTGAADALVAVADIAHAPPVPIESFEIPLEAVRLLGERLVRVRSVLPFARLGREWAVAVLNPTDEALRIEVTESLGARCHFFLAPPSSVEAVIERVCKSLGESGEEPLGQG